MLVTQTPTKKYFEVLFGVFSDLRSPEIRTIYQELIKSSLLKKQIKDYQVWIKSTNSNRVCNYVPGMGQKFALDVFFRCSKQMISKRPSHRPRRGHLRRGISKRPIEMQICHKVVSSSSLTHPPCPEI